MGGQLTKNKIVYRIHAIQRMFQRGVSEEDVRAVLKAGEVIEEYPDDKPYPSRLLFGYTGSRPLHVVAAENHEDDETIIITVYEPAAWAWEAGLKRRKKR